MHGCCQQCRWHLPVPSHAATARLRFPSQKGGPAALATPACHWAFSEAGPARGQQGFTDWLLSIVLTAMHGYCLQIECTQAAGSQLLTALPTSALGSLAEYILCVQDCLGT